MKLSTEQRDNLRESVSLVHAAIDALSRAVAHFPVVGDAELHVMRLDLRKAVNRLEHLRDDAAEILGEAS